MCVVCDGGESLADTVARIGFPPVPPVSRRSIIMSAGMIADGVAAQGVAGAALAQSSASSDPELARVRSQRRILLKGDEISVWPPNNAPSVVVNLMNPSHVETVFIAGEAKKWRGKLVDIDVARVLTTVADSRDAVLKRTNFSVDMVG